MCIACMQRGCCRHLQRRGGGKEVNEKMPKRSAYEANIDDDDDDMAAKRLLPSSCYNNWGYERSWRALHIGLRRYYRNSYPDITPGHICGLARLILYNREVRICWTPKTHFMRWEKEWRQIFMLLLLYRYDKLFLPWETVESIISYLVVSQSKICDECGGKRWAHYCKECYNSSHVVIDHRDLVKFL